MPWRTSTRIELAQHTGLSPATVSRITRDLVDEKLLKEITRIPTSVGRPTRGLEVNGGAGTVIGISVLLPSAELVLMDLRGQILRHTSHALDGTKGATGILEQLQKAVRSLLRAWPPRVPKLAGVGLAVPGEWHREGGIAVNYPRVPDWRNVPIGKLLQEWTGCPVSLIGYAPALAIAKSARHGETDPANMVCVEVSENIAMGIVVNGGVLEGVTGNAGELGHITIDADGPLCYCGNRGCLETVATCGAVEDEVRNSDAARDVFVNSRAVTFEDVVTLARQGDSFSTRLLARVARTLGIGLATALNLLNPKVLVLSGRFFDAGDLVMAPLRASIADHTLTNTMKGLIIEPSTLDRGASATGAGLAVVKNVVATL